MEVHIFPLIESEKLAVAYEILISNNCKNRKIIRIHYGDVIADAEFTQISLTSLKKTLSLT